MLIVKDNFLDFASFRLLFFIVLLHTGSPFCYFLFVYFASSSQNFTINTYQCSESNFVVPSFISISKSLSISLSMSLVGA